jgi:hypothetical protein
MARMGEGDSRMEGIEMVERAVFIPRRKVAWRRVPSWRCWKDSILMDEWMAIALEERQ